MYVPESFFNGEIRNGFYVEKLMKIVWAAQLEVLHDLDTFCKKYNIQYFGDYGTLLGAVRHKGFIPWDDDMDISMKREDYIRFCDLVKKEFDGQYEVVNFHTDPDLTHMVGRIINQRHISFAKDKLEKFHGCPFVVGIDIYPIDYIASNKEENDMQCNIIKLVELTIQQFSRYDDTEEQKIKTIHLIENMCGVKFDSNRSYIIQLRELEERLCMLYKEEEATCVAQMGAYIVNPQKACMKEWYESTIEVPFEYTTIQIPIGYKEILKKEFGENYMTPIIAKSGHEYPFYKEQLNIIYDEISSIVEKN